MRAPLISVIIPTLNEKAYLPMLLESLVGQTQRDFEVIVVDGKSRDKTVEIARSFGSKLPRLTVIEKVGPGVSLQRNRGASEASGSWLVFADADGVFLPHFMERVRQYVHQHDPQFLTTWFAPDSRVAGDAIVTLFIDMLVESSILLKRPFAPGPLTIVSRELFDRVGGYDEARTFGEDYEFGSRLFKRGVPLSILREALCVYSLRRFRSEGKLKLLQQYAKSILSVLVLNKSPRSMAGYMMGGALHKRKKRSAFKKFQMELKKIVKELME